MKPPMTGLYALKNAIFFLIVLSSVLLLSISIAYGEEITENLSLEEAFERASKMNPLVRLAQVEWETAKIRYDSTLLRLHFPSISLGLNVSLDQTAYQIPGSAAWKERDSNPSYRSGTYQGKVGLGLLDYPIFNSWLDSIDLKLAEIEKERAAVNYGRQMRELRYQVITSYFSLYQILKEEEVVQREVLLARAMLRLIKAKAAVGTLSQSDIQAAELDLAASEKRLIIAKTDSFEGRFDFLKSLGIQSNHIFRLTTEPNYFNLPISLENLKNRYEIYNEDLQFAKLSVEGSELSRDRAYRELFPVKISLSSAFWTHQFGHHFERSPIETSSIPDGNINASVAINVQIPIFGGGGILNSNVFNERLLEKKRAEESLRLTRMNGLMDLESLHGKIARSNQEIEATKRNLQFSTNLLSKRMSEPLKSDTQRLELRDLLINTRNIEIEYYQRVINYQQLVIRLSRVIGQDLTEVILK